MHGAKEEVVGRQGWERGKEREGEKRRVVDGVRERSFFYMVNVLSMITRVGPAIPFPHVHGHTLAWCPQSSVRTTPRKRG